MATLLEMASDIVAAHASTTPMTGEELLQSIQKVYASLQALESGKEVTPVEEEAKPTISAKQSIKANEVICLICGKGGMKTLTRHLKQAHELKPGQYKKQFGIKSTQPLAAKNFSAARRQSALDRGLGENLAKARAVRAANIEAKKTVPVKAKKAAPAKKVTAKAK
jgi:predicted transcriptional regulator